MRWIRNKKFFEQDGDTRIIRKFIWWPTSLPGEHGVVVTRWLEWAYIEQRYRNFERTVFPLPAANLAWLFFSNWINVKWKKC